MSCVAVNLVYLIVFFKLCKNFYLNVIFQIGNGEIDKKRNDLQNKVFQIQPH
jgi:hypothetical protein